MSPKLPEYQELLDGFRKQGYNRETSISLAIRELENRRLHSWLMKARAVADHYASGKPGHPESFVNPATARYLATRLWGTGPAQPVRPDQRHILREWAEENASWDDQYEIPESEAMERLKQVQLSHKRFPPKVEHGTKIKPVPMRSTDHATKELNLADKDIGYFDA